MDIYLQQLNECCVCTENAIIMLTETEKMQLEYIYEQLGKKFNSGINEFDDFIDNCMEEINLNNLKNMIITEEFKEICDDYERNEVIRFQKAYAMPKIYAPHSKTKYEKIKYKFKIEN